MHQSIETLAPLGSKDRSIMKYNDKRNRTGRRKLGHPSLRHRKEWSNISIKTETGLAQLVEHLTAEREVVSLIPGVGLILTGSSNN